jgi:hypothetical protein
LKKEKSTAKHDPTIAPGFTKDELEAGATSKEIEEGDSTAVTILENDIPSGER